MSPKENSLENTSLRLPVPYWAVGLILMLIIDAISFAVDDFRVTGNTLHDYDTLTRLAYLRGALQSHDFQHGFFARLNAPYGMVLHWTLPFNLYMIGLIKLFGWLVDPASAYQYAGYWAGTILRAFVGPAAYWAGRAFLKPASAAVASILVLFAPYLMAYAHHGSANHHALIYLESVLMFGLGSRLIHSPVSEEETKRPERNQDRLALVAGALAGLCLWTTFELVLAAGPFFAVMIYLWIMQGETRLRPLFLSCAAFAVTITFAVLIDPPYGGIGAPVLDHISMVYQSLASALLLVVGGAYFTRPKTDYKRAGYLISAGLVAGGIWLIAYPFVIGGVKGAMDPYVVREWMGNIEEILPIDNWRKLIAFLGPGLLAIVLVFTWRAPRVYKESVLMGLLGLYVLGQLHFRFALYDAVAAPYFLAYVFERARPGNDEFNVDYQRYMKGLILGVTAVLVAVQISITVIHYDVISPPEKDDVPDNVTCNPYRVRGPLNDASFLGIGKSNPIIMNEVNHAASLLYWTNVSPVAGNYHRDSQGIKDDYTFFRDLGDDTAKAIVKKRGVDFVMLCGNGNNAVYSFVSADHIAKGMAQPGEEFTPEDTIYTRLSDGNPPPWLKLRDWPDDVDTDLVLYQVDKKKLGK